MLKRNTLLEMWSMSHVKNKKCCEPGCAKRPHFGVGGTTYAQYCADHKKDGMVDIIHKKCRQPGCRKNPVFGVNGTTTALYCADHKKDGMVDVKNKRCREPGCRKQPCFGVVGTTIALYCAAHKKDGMVDIINKRCREPGCKTGARFGPLFGEAMHCAKHKSADEFVHRSPKCQGTDTCKERPTHTDETGIGMHNYPRYCPLHAKEGMIEVRGAICAKCKFDSIINTKTMLCAICEFGAKFGTYHKLKEEAMMRALDAIKLIPDSCDKVIDGSSECNVRKRPDAYFNRGSYALILEVDERQHARRFISDAGKFIDKYSCECELARMVMLHQVCGVPTIFVRFNPDEFVDNMDKVVRASDARFARTARYVQRMIAEFDASPPLDGLYASYLYYDGCCGSEADRLKIDYVDGSISSWEVSE